MAHGTLRSKPLGEALTCLVGACLGALLGGWLGGPLLAFVGAIFGGACGAQASQTLRGGKAARPRRARS